MTDTYKKAWSCIEKDDVDNLSSLLLNEMSDRRIALGEEFITSSLLHCAVSCKSVKCITWLLEKGGLNLARKVYLDIFQRVNSTTTLVLLLEYLIIDYSTVLWYVRNWNIPFIKVLLDYNYTIYHLDGDVSRKYKDLIQRRQMTVSIARLILESKHLKKKIGKDCVQVLSKYVFATRYRGF